MQLSDGSGIRPARHSLSPLHYSRLRSAPVTAITTVIVWLQHHTQRLASSDSIAFVVDDAAGARRLSVVCGYVACRPVVLSLSWTVVL